MHIDFHLAWESTLEQALPSMQSFGALIIIINQVLRIIKIAVKALVNVVRLPVNFPH